MSDATHDPASPESTIPASSASKARNPVERVVVWGVIAALAVVVGLEAMARFGYTNTLNRLQAALAKDEAPDAEPLTLPSVSKMISGFPTRQENEGRIFGEVQYRWKGLLKDYGGIRLIYSMDDRVVMGLETDLPPEEPQATLAAAAPPADGMDSPRPGTEENATRESGSADGSQRIGGRRLTFSELDTDGDGKLSRDETPEQLLESFSEIDMNADGFIDEEELTAFRAARRGNRQRPQSETASPAPDAP